MKNTVTFSTAKGNIYLYSPFRNQFLLLHPLIQFYYTQHHKDNNHIPPTPPNASVELKGYGVFSKAESLEQWKKYRFLSKSGFFEPSTEINFDGLLHASQIEDNISQIKQVIFETTEDCNLSCTYCIYSKFYINKERGKRNFDLDQAKMILNMIMSRRRKENSNELVISFYGGEPLKNITFIKQIVEFLESSYNAVCSFKFTMSSNGLLLAKHAEFLSQHSFDVSISLDGDETGNSFRVLKNNRSSYHRVIKNLDSVKASYPDWFDKKISFLTVLHSRNSYTSLHDFFSERYQKKTLISTINTISVNDEYRDEFISTFLNRKQEEVKSPTVINEMFLEHPGVKDLSDILEKYSGFVFRNKFSMISAKTKKPAKKRFIPTATCMPFSLRVFLAADGSILPCEHVSRIFEIGRISNEEIKIDSGAIASQYNQYFSKIKSLCKNCYFSDNCKECVFNTKIETEKPHCEYYSDAKRFSDYLAQSINLIEQDYPLFLRINKEAFDAQ